MALVEEIDGAATIVETCAGVKPGEQVLIVGDWRTADTTERLATAAAGAGADPTVTLMDILDEDGNEPPETVAAAMLEADVIMLVPTRAIAHSASVKRALENDARVLAMGQLSPETLVNDGLKIDFHEAATECEAIARRFTESESARVVDEGTDLTFDLSGRDGNAFTSLVENPGEFTTAYATEANVTPSPIGTNGRAVFDGSIPNLGIGRLDEALTIKVEDGTVTELEGGDAARKVKRTWNKYDDPAVRTVAELAVGTNPGLTEFTGGVINDHGVYGTVHVGLGTSSNIGGETRTPLHFDITMDDASLYLDGELVVEDREILL
ncbi:aminopeptidase [Halobellus rubicundus]|uniref:Aminopeptidase n=1 Tax=Halobellus rubicundus TaxID=2996466 RepID=A0ABD5ME26_9EURY